MPYPSARGVSLLAGMIAIALGTLAQGFAVPPAPTGMVLKQPQHSVHHRHEGRLGPYRVESPLVFSSSSFLPPVSRGMGGGSSLPATATSMSCMLAVGRTACAKLAPASAAVAAAVLRGGAVVEHNVLSGVLAELANIRTPAALLGGAALGTMFVSPKPTGNKRLHLLYTALATSAFSLQLVCVLCSTLTYTAVASYNEAIAVSAIAFLSDKMQFEFYVIRGSFVYGLFSFLAALMVRGWLTFSSDGNRGSARVMMAILASSGIFLLNFIHHTHNTLTKCLGGMTKRLVWLTMSNMYTSKRRLFRHTLGAAAVWGMVKFFKLGPNEGGGAETAEPQAAGTPKNIPSKPTK